MREENGQTSKTDSSSEEASAGSSNYLGYELVLGARADNFLHLAISFVCNGNTEESVR